MRRNGMVKFVVVILIIGILACIAAFGAPFLGIPSVYDTRLGIDIKGGVYTTLYPDLPEGVEASNADLESAQRKIEIRLDSKGIFDRNIALEKDNKRIVVEIPYKQGEKDSNPQKAIDEIGRTALLTFQEVDETKVDENGDYLPTGIIIVEGEHVEDAGVTTNSETGRIAVSLKFNKEGTEKFAEATERLVGKPIAIFMDDEMITAPNVEHSIPSGNAIITGQRDAKEAGQLAATIRAGALPFRLVAKEINSITPLLGEGALKITIYAGIISYLLVFLFMLLYYRLSGLIANIALFGLVVIQLIFISLFGITLTLPGMAGIILSVGMGVDANIIIFERIKEELKTGKTLRASIDVGFKRAFSAILDANVTTLISAGVLYWLGTGPIKGFAITLGLGVILSFLTAVTASRIMLKGISDTKIAKNHWLYGA